MSDEDDPKAKPSDEDDAKPEQRGGDDPKQERGFTLAGGPEPPGDTLPAIDFSTFVLSLAASAMLHMGRAPEISGEKAEKSLPIAQQTIDTLEMLEVKTRGNLEEDETKLLQSVLYELRMEFVKARDES